jgi:hypothetical protein
MNLKPSSALQVFDLPLSATIPVSPGYTTDELIRVEDDAWFVGLSMSAEFTGRFRCMMRDSSGRHYMNEPIENEILFGTSYLPFVFSFPLVLEPDAELYFDLYDQTGAPNTVRINLHGYKHKDKVAPPKWGLVGPDGSAATGSRDQWFMVASTKTLVPGDTKILPLKIEAGADYEINSYRAFASILTGGAFEAQLRTAAGTWLHRSPVTKNTGFGNAQYPYKAAPPLRQKAAQTMQMTVHNLAGGIVNNTVQVALDGVKRYR